MQTGSSQLLLTGVSTHAPGSLRTWARADSTSAPALTLAQYASVWLDGLEGRVSPSTVVAYAGRLERHVLPQLGETLIDAITVDDVLALIRDLRQEGYSGTTIATSLTPLSRLLGQAVRRGLIGANPVSKLDRSERPRISRKERPVRNREEIGRLLEAAPTR